MTSVLYHACTEATGLWQIKHFMSFSSILTNVCKIQLKVLTYLSETFIHIMYLVHICACCTKKNGRYMYVQAWALSSETKCPLKFRKKLWKWDKLQVLQFTCDLCVLLYITCMLSNNTCNLKKGSQLFINFWLFHYSMQHFKIGSNGTFMKGFLYWKYHLLNKSKKISQLW